MTVRYLVAGDQGVTDDIEFEGVVDLLGVTLIRAHVWRPVGPPDRHELEVTMVNATERIIRVHYGTEAPDPEADPPVVGDWLPSQTAQAAWRFEVEATWPDQPAVTNPRRAPVVLKVRTQGDP